MLRSTSPRDCSAACDPVPGGPRPRGSRLGRALGWALVCLAACTAGLRVPVTETGHVPLLFQTDAGNTSDRAVLASCTERLGPRHDALDEGEGQQPSADRTLVRDGAFRSAQLELSLDVLGYGSLISPQLSHNAAELALARAASRGAIALPVQPTASTQAKKECRRAARRGVRREGRASDPPTLCFGEQQVSSRIRSSQVDQRSFAASQPPLRPALSTCIKCSSISSISHVVPSILAPRHEYDVHRAKIMALGHA